MLTSISLPSCYVKYVFWGWVNTYTGGLISIYRLRWTVQMDPEIVFHQCLSKKLWAKIFVWWIVPFVIPQRNAFFLWKCCPLSFIAIPWGKHGDVGGFCLGHCRLQALEGGAPVDQIDKLTHILISGWCLVANYPLLVSGLVHHSFLSGLTLLIRFITGVN